MEKIETEAMETRPGDLGDDVTDTWLDLHTKQRRVHCTQKKLCVHKKHGGRESRMVGNRGRDDTAIHVECAFRKTS